MLRWNFQGSSCEEIGVKNFEISNTRMRSEQDDNEYFFTLWIATVTSLTRAIRGGVTDRQNQDTFVTTLVDRFI